MITAVLFDMDGVLVESFDAWHALVSAAATHFGHPPVSVEAFRKAFGQPTQTDVDLFFPDQSVEVAEAYYSAHFADHAAAAQARPGAHEVLDVLAQRGIPTAVLTNTASGVARSLLQRLDLIPNALVCADNVGNPKPAPDMIFRACEVLSAEPWDALVVGDTVYDRQAAAGAGAPFAGIGGIAGNFTIAHLDQVPSIVDGTF